MALVFQGGRKKVSLKDEVWTNRREKVSRPKVFGGSRSMTRKLQELSDSEEDEELLVFEWEEELLDEEEEQLERLSFVNSNTKRELRGAWGRSEINLAGICRDRWSLLSEKLLMGFPPSDCFDDAGHLLCVDTCSNSWQGSGLPLLLPFFFFLFTFPFQTNPSDVGHSDPPMPSLWFGNKCHCFSSFCYWLLSS